jgi:hypothetical protein
MSQELQLLQSRIHSIRGEKVMLASDLAEIYGVETRALNQAVKRNPARFPSRFMFQLTAEEVSNLKSQFVTSSWGGARRALPYAFTEHGAVMLAAVLNSQNHSGKWGIGAKARMGSYSLVLTPSLMWIV